METVSLHMPSLLFSMTVAAITVSSILLAIRVGDKGQGSTGLWTLGNFLVAGGTILIGSQATLPPPAAISLGNTATVMGASLLVVSLRRILGKPAPWVRLCVLWAGGFLVFLYFSTVDVDVLARIIAVSVLLGGISAWGVVSLLPLQRALRGSQILLMVFFGLFAAYSTFRLVHALFADPISDFLRAGAVQGIAMLICVAVVIGLSMGYLWLLNQRLNAFLWRANELLRRSNADLDEFARVLSHDLRSPLTAARLYLGGVADLIGPDATPELHSVLAKVNAVHARMGDMIDGALQFATFEGQNRSIHAMAAGGEALERALGNLVAEIAAAGAEIRVDPLPELRVDPVGLVRVFQNLVGNAVKFRRPDAAPVIEIAAERDGEAWHFRVADNGIGIPPTDREAVFALFRRGADHPGVPGNGIGLAECRRIIERHGGRIWVESIIGAGSTVHFTIPDICAGV